MQGNVFAHTKNTQHISQKNVAKAGAFKDQQQTQSIPLMHKSTENIHIKHINEEEDAEEARRSARQAESDAAAARQAAEDARRDSSPYVYDDPDYDSDYYDDGPYLGFGIGGHRRHHGWHHGGGHGGGHHR
jgi:hypothetical protein